MREIKALPITLERFAKFGQFYPMAEPEGYAMCGELFRFYPDRLTADDTHRIGYSPILVRRPEEMQITRLERHTTTWEMLLPLTDDMILHCTPVSWDGPLTELTEAFVVPKFTLVKLNAGVWHLAPLPVSEGELRAIVVLPECTYVNDCQVVDLEPKQYVRITNIK